jgi:antitoxin component of MazEF toxin-antitoxin module
MMTKRLSAVGNSAAIIIDKPILDILDIGMETELNIHTDGQNLIISPIKKDQERRVQAAHARVIARHGKTFKKLAG